MAIAKATTKNKPVAKKIPSTKAAAPKKAAPKKAAAKKTTPKKSADKSGFERYKMIEVAAYYKAEMSGFVGCAVDYWIVAEKEIDKKLSK